MARITDSTAVFMFRSDILHPVPLTKLADFLSIAFPLKQQMFHIKKKK